MYNMPPSRLFRKATTSFSNLSFNSALNSVRLFSWSILIPPSKLSIKNHISVFKGSPFRQAQTNSSHFSFSFSKDNTLYFSQFSSIPSFHGKQSYINSFFLHIFCDVLNQIFLTLCVQHIITCHLQTFAYTNKFI